MKRLLGMMICSLGLGAAGAPPALAQDALKTANEAYERGDYSSALSSWQGLANQGHPLAAYRLGHLYRSGKGVMKNHKRAMHWFGRAARQRVAAAFYQMGMMHLAGEYVMKDIAAAWAHFKVAARLGDGRGVAMTGYLGTRMNTLELWRGRQMSRELWPRRDKTRQGAAAK